MATIEALLAEAERIRSAVKLEVDLAEQLVIVREKIAAGNTVTEADLDQVLVALQSIGTDVRPPPETK